SRELAPPSDALVNRGAGGGARPSGLRAARRARRHRQARVRPRDGAPVAGASALPARPAAHRARDPRAERPIVIAEAGGSACSTVIESPTADPQQRPRRVSPYV